MDKLKNSVLFGIVGCLLTCTFPCSGSSIFDDDYKPPAGDETSAPKSVDRKSPVPQEMQPPKGAQPPRSQSAPHDSPPQSDDVSKKLPSTPDVVNPTPPAPNLPIPNSAGSKPAEDPRVKAEENLAAAKSRAEALVDKNPDYLEAKAASEATKKALDAARDSGTSEEKTVAWNAWSKAQNAVKTIHDSAVNQDADYAKAKAEAAKLDDSKPTVAGKSPGDESPVPPEIAEAIAAHNFVMGMSFRQACKAAYSAVNQHHVEIVSTIPQSKTKIVRWVIKGKLGTYHTERVMSFGSATEYRVQDYGTLGYVYGTFVDDKLTDFKRVRAE